MIGCLALGSLEKGRYRFASVRHGLAATGYVEGRDFDVEFRAADYQIDRLREVTADLVERNVAVIVTLATPCLEAALSATKSIPIVFYTGVDPVENRFVSSLNHPGGNRRAFSRSATRSIPNDWNYYTTSRRQQMPLPSCGAQRLALRVKGRWVK